MLNVPTIQDQNRVAVSTLSSGDTFLTDSGEVLMLTTPADGTPVPAGHVQVMRVSSGHCWYVGAGSSVRPFPLCVQLP